MHGTGQTAASVGGERGMLAIPVLSRTVMAVAAVLVAVWPGRAPSQLFLCC